MDTLLERRALVGVRIGARPSLWGNALAVEVLVRSGLGSIKAHIRRKKDVVVPSLETARSTDRILGTGRWTGNGDSLMRTAQSVVPPGKITGFVLQLYNVRGNGC